MRSVSDFAFSLVGFMHSLSICLYGMMMVLTM